MISEKNTLIGHLVEANGADFVVQLISEDEGFIPEVTVGGVEVRIGQIGSYLMVRQTGSYVLVIVESMWQEVEPEGGLTRMVRVNPLGEITAKGGFERGVAHFPTPGAELHLVTGPTLELLFSKYSAADFKVGKLSSFDTVDVFIDPDAFFGRHAAILGQSGSGKSWSVTSFIQSTLKAMPNAHIIILDLHGEYGSKDWDPNTRPPFPEGSVRCIKASELEIPYWLLTYEELIELLIDDDDPNASVQIAFLRGSLLELKREANEHLDLGHITVDSPIFFSMDDLVNRFKNANETTADFGKSKTALTGKFDQLLVKLQSRLNDTRYDFLLRPQKRVSSESLAGLLRDFAGLGDPSAKVTVLDLSSIPFDVHPTVTAQIGRLAFEFNYWNPNCRDFPLFLVAEEAHSYIPRAHVGGHQGTRRSFERIAKAGRKYAVGLCVVSQRPNELSETVLSQCSTFICLRITNPDDQEYVRALVPDAARGILEALTSLAQGEAIATGEGVPMPVRFRVTMPDPPPNAQSIEYAGMWAKGPQDTDVEHIVDCWRRQRR
ncbi:MAG: ATP-binding protein [Xanthomonadales bacterium]|nr:ATP-binding protein [Gammaproteobacteria bacterium]MBT8054713.1 ATP-binding protein [Gammaproteobacteria bacterium]NND57793.1 ATP-binding protein [Xanthomonadales bacterium]NNK51442.1 ATP-binding protein [Xanthomonadales bacterium]